MGQNLSSPPHQKNKIINPTESLFTGDLIILIIFLKVTKQGDLSPTQLTDSALLVAKSRSRPRRLDAHCATPHGQREVSRKRRSVFRRIGTAEAELKQVPKPKNLMRFLHEVSSCLQPMATHGVQCEETSWLLAQQ